MITKKKNNTFFIGDDLAKLKKIAHSMAKGYPCYQYKDAFQDAVVIYLQNRDKFNKRKGGSLYNYIRNRIVDKLAYERFASNYICTFPKSYIKNKGKDGKKDFDKINEMWGAADFELAERIGYEDHYCELNKLKTVIIDCSELLDEDCKTLFKLTYDTDNDFEPLYSMKDIQTLTGWSCSKTYKVKTRMLNVLKELLEEWM